VGVIRFAGRVEVVARRTLAAAAETGLRIEPAVLPADAAALQRVAEAAADEHVRVSGAGLAAELRGRPGRVVEGWLAWMSSVAGEPAAVGLALMVVGGNEPSIAWLLVDRAMRRRGVASALVATAVARAAALGAARVTAESLESWPAAEFWLQAGFEPVARPRG